MIERIKELAAANYTAGKIAKSVDITINEVRRFCKIYRIKLYNKQTKEERNNKIKELYKDNNLAQLGRLFNLSRQRIWQILKEGRNNDI